MPALGLRFRLADVQFLNSCIFNMRNRATS